MPCFKQPKGQIQELKLSMRQSLAAGDRPLNRCYKHASREVILPTVGKSIRAGSCSVSMFKPTTANQLPTSIRAKVGIT